MNIHGFNISFDHFARRVPEHVTTKETFLKMLALEDAMQGANASAAMGMDAGTRERGNRDRKKIRTACSALMDSWSMDEMREFGEVRKRWAKHLETLV